MVVLESTRLSNTMIELAESQTNYIISVALFADPLLHCCTRLKPEESGAPPCRATVMWQSELASRNACPTESSAHIQSREVLSLGIMDGLQQSRRMMFVSCAEAHYCPACRCSRCFSTAKLESMNLSTQFCMQLSSLPASLPDDIEPVMHFLKQVSVSS